MTYDTENPKSVLCNKLEGCMGREVGKRFKREGTHVYLWLIYVDIWQKPAQCGKAIILQLKISKILKLASETSPCGRPGFPQSQ